jgi:hypothetical protein
MCTCGFSDEQVGTRASGDKRKKNTKNETEKSSKNKLVGRNPTKNGSSFVFS